MVDRLVTITGPSGVGKDTVVRALEYLYPDTYKVAVSHTTRAPREGETHGEAYYFVSPEDFEVLVFQDAFLESVEYSGNSYAVSRKEVSDINSGGLVPLLIVEYNGAQQIQDSFVGDLLQVFLIPQGDSVEDQLETLYMQMSFRGDSEDSVKKRLALAAAELANQDEFDLILPNIEIEETAHALDLAIQQM